MVNWRGRCGVGTRRCSRAIGVGAISRGGAIRVCRARRARVIPISCPVSGGSRQDLHCFIGLRHSRKSTNKDQLQRCSYSLHHVLRGWILSLRQYTLVLLSRKSKRQVELSSCIILLATKHGTSEFLAIGFEQPGVGGVGTSIRRLADLDRHRVAGCRNC
jgi:hypothetical protein